MEARDEILTAKEVALTLKCSVSYVYRLRDRGLPPRFKFGSGQKGWRWSKTDLEQFIRAHEVTQQTFSVHTPLFDGRALTNALR